MSEYRSINIGPVYSRNGRGDPDLGGYQSRCSGVPNLGRKRWILDQLSGSRRCSGEKSKFWKKAPGTIVRSLQRLKNRSTGRVNFRGPDHFLGDFWPDPAYPICFCFMLCLAYPICFCFMLCLGGSLPGGIPLEAGETWSPYGPRPGDASLVLLS